MRSPSHLGSPTFPTTREAGISADKLGAEQLIPQYAGRRAITSAFLSEGKNTWLLSRWRARK
jgi:hypothetical protein